MRVHLGIDNIDKLGKKNRLKNSTKTHETRIKIAKPNNTQLNSVKVLKTTKKVTKIFKN